MNPFHKFYKKSLRKRQEIIKNEFSTSQFFQPLQEKDYDNMIENAITTYEIPMGIAPNFVMNNQSYTIPMVTEEPSVIAAQSNAAKIIGINGGIEANIQQNLMRGQLAFPNPTEKEIQYLKDNIKPIQKIGNKAHPSIVKRGGGIKDIKIELKTNPSYTDFLIIYVFIDTKEAMGANIINTIMEHLKTYLERELEMKATMGILSNLATESVVSATCSIDVSTLKYSDTIGQRFQEASHLALVDPYRATTHNKGIMNGIDALALATGNDTRAIESAAHAYASLQDQYKPLSTWTYQDDIIIGKIELPITVGSVGGTIKMNPKTQMAREILGNPNKETLMKLLASVGLAQNFAALYALITDGIQKGHMNLQARALAISVGTKEDELDVVLEKLQAEKNINTETVKTILDKLRNNA